MHRRNGSIKQGVNDETVAGCFTGGNPIGFSERSHRRKGQKVELYDMSTDEGEKINLADEFPEVVERIQKAMNKAHRPNPFWNKDTKPLYNADAACKATGEEPIPKKKKNKKSERSL